MDNGYKKEGKSSCKRIPDGEEIKVLDFARFKVGEGID